MCESPMFCIGLCLSPLSPVLLVSKYPTPGTSKTRLIPALGAVLAAKLAMAMLQDLLKRFSIEVSYEKLCVRIWRGVLLRVANGVSRSRMCVCCALYVSASV